MCAGAATTSRSAGAENYMRYIAIRDSVELLDTGGYMKYIAERLRSHVLFSNGKVVGLKQMMNKVSAHPAPVWTLVCSLRRCAAFHGEKHPLTST